MPNTCNTCTTQGSSITADLIVGINNKTGSTRTSFEFWATLVIYDNNGNIVSQSPISFCTGPIPSNATTFYTDKGGVTYPCGSRLMLTNIWEAWTDASPGAKCPLNPALIAPKCGTLSSLTIQEGLEAAFTDVQVTCNSLGSITVNAANGTAPYTYSWATGQTTQTINNLSPGTYTVTITDSKGCSITRSTTITQVSTSPNTYSVTGGGAFCSGGTGVAVGLSGSQTGVNYQLYNGANAVGSPVAGTGNALSFGLQTTAGTYTVVATSGGSCTANMSGNATVSVNPLPTAYSVTGGGSYCSGGTGVTVGLSGSQTGVNYQLYNGANAVGSPVAGTGNALSFGLQTAAGTYTVVATNGTTSCTANMSGNATVSINPLPAAYSVTGGGAYCSGGSGVAVGLSGSQTGVNYQLYNGANTVGSPVAGTGNALNFGLQTAAGTYTVVATNGSTSCAVNMTGNAMVSINPLPTVYTVTGGGSYCTGGNGVSIGLSGSETGVNYQLYNGANAVGSPVSGTGNAISFGLQTTAGTYTVVATNGTTSCTANMSGSVAVSVNSLPSAPSLTEVQPDLCTNPTGTLTVNSPINGTYTISFSAQGINYPNNTQTYNSSSPTTISFANIPAGSGPSIYVVDANGCQSQATNCSSTNPVQITSVQGPAKQEVNLGSGQLDPGLTIKTVPNPFSSNVRFYITAPESGVGRLELFNTLGQKVKTIYEGYIQAGPSYYDLNLNGRNSAEFFYIFTLGTNRIAGKILQLQR